MNPQHAALTDALTRAANYIDALGGDSKPYRAANSGRFGAGPAADYAAMLSASPAAPAPCAMVGLTEDEQRQIWIEVKGTANGYGPVMDAAIRAFCQKNNITFQEPCS